MIRVWPFSRLADLQAQVEGHQLDLKDIRRSYALLVDEYATAKADFQRSQKDLVSALEDIDRLKRKVSFLQELHQAERTVIKDLGQQLETARKNDTRGPDGRFMKAPPSDG